MNTLLSTFGSNGITLRARGTDTLDIEEIAARIPAILATEPHSSRSTKYSYIPTYDIMKAMLAEGFLPVEARQGGTRNLEKRGFTKHLLRFRHHNSTPVLNDTFPEITLVNSHDGTSSYILQDGWFRLVCLNGMVVPEQEGTTMRVPHKGNVDDVIEASYRVVEDVPRQRAQIEHFSSISLSPAEQSAFAEAAIPLRFESHQAVPVQEVLRTRRSEDRADNLWTTFNRVQENLTKGDVRFRSTSPTGQRSRRHSKPIHDITEDTKLNQALWTLTEKMASLKGN